VWRWQKATSVTSSQKEAMIPAALAAKLALAALAVLAILVGGQILHQPKAYVVKTVVPKGSMKQETNADRQIDIFEGRFRFGLRELPLSGIRSLEHRRSSVRYTCVTCRKMHGPLIEVLDQNAKRIWQS
jgi:hypothetical protein